MATKIYRIVIDNRYFFAKYYKGEGWRIDVPTGTWYFDDTIPNMKREVQNKYPTAKITKVK